jgi:hypothetical protein
LLEGDDVISADWRGEQVSESDYDVWLDLEIASDYFSCENCRCVLDGFELLEAAALPSAFEAVGDPADFYEPDYGND